MIKNNCKSETLFVGMLLAIVGGFLDAYSYILRGHVFANAETGNMVLFGIKLSEGNISGAIIYLVPIISFFMGIMIAEVIKSKYKNKQVHWRLIIIIIEMLAIAIVAFLPQYLDSIANAMISFICALQVETFRKVNGNPYATTMCTGNLRSGTESMHHYFDTKDKKYLIKSMQYFFIISIFIIGACIGTILSNKLGDMCILFSIIPLAVVAYNVKDCK